MGNALRATSQPTRFKESCVTSSGRVGVELTEDIEGAFQRSLDLNLGDREISLAEDLGREPRRKRKDPRSDLRNDLREILLDSFYRDELFAFFGKFDLFQLRLDRQELMTRLAGARLRDRTVASFRVRALD